MIKKNLAFIPARGGSKRLKHKNILNFAGIPLIAHTINYALNSKLFCKVIVSTDDDDIANISRKYGAEVIFRPMEISGDLATTSEALIHTYLKSKGKGKHFDALVTLQTTNLFRTQQLLKKCLEKFYSLEGYDSLITVNENIKKMATIENGKFLPFNYSTEQRSQDLEKLYYENGLIYITKPSSIIKNNDLFGKDIYPFVVDDLLAYVDIDTKEEFDLAESLFKLHENKYK